MNLDRALEIAVRAHAGQKDKAGEPYILHPLRLMLGMATEEERIVAVLHDVIEDSAVTLDDLKRAGFRARVLAAVDCLTRRDGETYDDYVTRAGSRALARRVKLADLKDNMRMRRTTGLAAKEPARMQRYLKAYRRLVKEMP
jgi:(p)ppGpp synthase/HD superfamily hydrolase